MAEDKLEFEKKYVHEVYNNIAKHFDKTRYSIWNKVKQFIDSMSKDSTMADIGCGNGKNMKYKNTNAYGCDASEELVKICQKADLNVKNGDVTAIPFENNFFDHTICIAVIHHLSTNERRIKAIEELIRITKHGGTIMILVWALEQVERNKVRFTEADNFVDWKDLKTGKIHKRYYHVFAKGELEELIKLVNSDFKIELQESFYDEGNWGVIIKKLE